MPSAEQLYLTTILAITGTFTGPLKGPKGMIAPTGKRFEITVVDVHEFDDQGRFLFTRAFMDVHSFMRQLGVDPSEYLDAYDPEVYVREARAKQAEIWRAGSLPGR